MFIDKLFSRTFSDVLAEWVEHIFRSAGNLFARTKDPVLGSIAEQSTQAVKLKPANPEMSAMLTTDIPEAWFIKLVEDSLRKHSDSVALGQSPLADYLSLSSDSRIARGKLLQQLLNDAIQSLRPAGIRPTSVVPRAWYNYIVLHDAYVIGLRNRDVMAKLYISEGTFNRTRRIAVRGVAIWLIEAISQRNVNN
jgi:hypothetical protein